MKKFNSIGLGIVFIGLITMFVFTNQSKNKIGYIDANKLLQGYKGMIDVRKDMQEKAKIWEANVDTLIRDWENELRGYEKERASMSSREQAKREEVLRNKQQQINKYRESLQQKAAAEDSKMQQTVLDEMNIYIKEYGKKHNYDYILGATGTGNILYANDAKEVTEDILDNLNSKYDKNQGK